MFSFDSGSSTPCDGPMLAQMAAINEAVVLALSRWADNASVTSSAALADDCFVSFTGGNQIQQADCGTNDPGQSSCTGVQFQPAKDDVTAPM